MLLKYEKLNNEKTELFDAIQKFREYRDKAIEIKYDYDKLIEREMEKNLFVNYNARCNDYKNIKCTKYVFKIQNHLRMYWYIVKI